MTDTKKKAQFITSSAHAMVSRQGAPSDVLAPGERVAIDGENASHKYLLDQIEAGNPDYSHLSVVEVDLAAEEEQEAERAELLKKAAQIAAEARQEQAQAELDRQERTNELREQAEEEGQPAVGQSASFPEQDVEAQRLAEQSGAGQRASTQDDVVEEPTTRRRSGRSGKGG